MRITKQGEFVKAEPPPLPTGCKRDGSKDFQCSNCKCCFTADRGEFEVVDCFPGREFYAVNCPVSGCRAKVECR